MSYETLKPILGRLSEITNKLWNARLLTTDEFEIQRITEAVELLDKAYCEIIKLKTEFKPRIRS